MMAPETAKATYNPWTYYYADTILIEADGFSIKRYIEFMESPHTRAVWVKSPPGADYLEIAVTGQCSDGLGGDVVCRFAFVVYSDGADVVVPTDEEKKRILAEIGRRYPGKTTPNHLRTKREAARVLGMPRYFTS